MSENLPIVEFTRVDHFEMVRAITKKFGPPFAPDCVVAYADETDETPAQFDTALLAELGVDVDIQRKMPDVVLHSPEKNWLFLVESVTSHGLINRKRRAALAKAFAGSTATLIFVTAFPSRAFMAESFKKITWGTVLWAANEPTHLIHLDPPHLFGPYTKQ